MTTKLYIDKFISVHTFKIELESSAGSSAVPLAKVDRKIPFLERI